MFQIVDRMFTFAQGIHGKRFSYAKFAADNGKSATPLAVE